ncbi:MAG: phosphoglucosamine mutase [Thermoplasmata archaeon]|nr:MAG: phosphoglucosamine mutase [Thermoplasmata archaeon]
MFGTSGIRGVVNKEITPELALKVGEACGSIYKKVVVGNDPRTSSLMIKNALISGLLACGVDVVDIGFVSTPTLAYSAKKYDIGIMITASHNPSQYNGIKIFKRDGSGIPLKEARRIEEIVRENKKRYVNWDEIGEYRKEDAIGEHINGILQDVGEIENEMKVVVDCSNGATSTITPYLLRKMGCKVITLNAQPDGYFPAHNPEPVEENLQQLKSMCGAERAIGIAHDCDGDRMVVVSNDGNYIENDKLIVMFAKYVNARKVVVPVDSSMVIDDYVDAEVIKTRVGDIFISEMLKETKGDFGAEASGTWIFPSFSYCPDGIYAAAKFVKMADEIDVFEEIGKLPSYPLKRGSVMADRDKIKEALSKIEEEIKKLDFVKLIDVDGLRIEMEDAWVLIRPSGTEPKIRITVEAKEKSRMEKLWNDVFNMVKGCLK